MIEVHKKRTLGIVRYGFVTENVLELLIEKLPQPGAFGGLIRKVKIFPEVRHFPKLSYDNLRQQYNSSDFLSDLRVIASEKKYDWVLGVTDVDIFSHFKEDFAFIFGVADHGFPNTKCALISTHRLRSSYYNKLRDDELFLLRTLKEAIHELGHVFGLKHCENFCIMCFSNSIEDTDEKPAHFCNDCKKKLSYYPA